MQKMELNFFRGAIANATEVELGWDVEPGLFYAVDSPTVCRVSA